jgi:hypothetical protein
VFFPPIPLFDLPGKRQYLPVIISSSSPRPATISVSVAVFSPVFTGFRCNTPSAPTTRQTGAPSCCTTAPLGTTSAAVLPHDQIHTGIHPRTQHSVCILQINFHQQRASLFVQRPAGTRQQAPLNCFCCSAGIRTTAALPAPICTASASGTRVVTRTRDVSTIRNIARDPFPA